MPQPESPPLKPLLPQGVPCDRLTWEREIRPALRRRWSDLLGRPAFDVDGYDRQASLVAQLEHEGIRFDWWQQPTGPGQSQKVIVLTPLTPHAGPKPGAVVPFYHPEQVAGLKPASSDPTLAWDDRPDHATQIRQWGVHLARQGFIVACVEAFPFNTVPAPTPAPGSHPKASSFAWWSAAATKLLADHPQWTGLGKLTHDTMRGVDLLLEQPGVDHDRVAMAGHSLGGKRTFYAMALDERVKAGIASDFGIPWRSTNWQDPWYLGQRVPVDESDLAHHQLLGLMAPRPFYLIAGQTDTQASWAYLDAARPVYDLYDPEPELLDGIDHATGHAPTPEAMNLAYAWLRRRLNLPDSPWRLTLV